MDREYLKDKKKIVIKIGSSSLIHEETGGLDYTKLEKLVRIICDLRNQDKDVVLVSSGAIGVGVQALGLARRPKTTSLRQACAAVGQGQLMMIYQKLFQEYHSTAAQVLLTFDVISSDERRKNAINTFNELLQLGVVPIVNENDTVAIDELDDSVAFGDNDTLSAIVASMIHADLLILLTDIDGLYTDDPHNTIIIDNTRFFMAFLFCSHLHFLCIFQTLRLHFRLVRIPLFCLLILLFFPCMVLIFL